jgi:phosphate-selective porin
LLACTTALHAQPLPSPEYVYKSADGSFTFDPHFVSQLDFNTVIADKAGKENSDFRYRRQRFGAAGIFASDWRYQLFMELSGGKAQVRDGFIAYTGLPNWWFVAGQFREYGSMDEQSSFIHLHFLERPYAMTAFQPLRNRGVGINPFGKDWSYQFGLFTDGTGEAGDEDGGWGISTRLHGQLYNDVATSHLLHLGIHARYREPGNGIARFRANGDEAVLRDPLVSTPVLRDTDSFASIGGEVYATEGPLSFLTEVRGV